MSGAAGRRSRAPEPEQGAATPDARPDWLSGSPGDWVLSIRAQPGASRSEPAGEHDGCLRVRIAAPPVDGRANEALRAFLAERLELPRAAVRIEHGDVSRRKRVRVAAPCDAATLAARLGADPPARAARSRDT